MKWVGLFITAAVLSFTGCGVAQAQPATDLIITEVMTGSSSSASSEFIELYNQSDTSIVLTDVKIQYQASSQDITAGTWTTKATLDGQLKPHGFLLASTSVFNTEQSIAGDFLLSSGLSGAAGRLRILNGGATLDSLTWGNGVAAIEGTSIPAVSAGFSYKRIVDQDAQFVDTNNNSTDFVGSDSPHAQGGGVEDVLVDVCPATPEVDISLPDGYEIDADGNCVPITTPALCQNNVVISEFVSDPVGLEADGGEFIELYNPDNGPVQLQGCGVVSSKSPQSLYSFTNSDMITGHGYFVIYTTDKLVNASGSVTFVATGREDVINYSNLHEGDDMSYFETGWEVTNQPSPMLANLHAVENAPGMGSGSSTATLAPCPTGKYRNPDTNRCRTLELAVATLAPCDEDQFRNPLTNRCKSIATTAGSSQSCPAGQERNPETNRCRKTAKTANQPKPCDPGQERNPDTNRCRKVVTQSANQSADITSKPGSSRLSLEAIAILGLISFGYVGYEYRSDAQLFIEKLLVKLGRRKPPG